MPIGSRIQKNLEMQGFQCGTPQFDAVEPWLRLSPLVCFAIVAYGLYSASATVFFALAVFVAIGAVTRHAGADYIYNFGIRFLTKTPALPPNPPPRRFACVVGTFWSFGIALAFLYGHAALAYALGIAMLFVITPMILRHFCVASLIFQKLIGFRSVV